MSGTRLQYGDMQIGEAPADWGKVRIDGNLFQVLGGSPAPEQERCLRVSHIFVP
jgi:hypothetical protein